MMSVLPAALLGLMRAVVVTVGEQDPSVLEGVRALGADTVVTYARPSAVASALAAANGLRYVPFLSVSDVAAFSWGGASVGPLFGLSSTPVLARAFTRLFYGLTPEPAIPVVGPRRTVPGR